MSAWTTFILRWQDKTGQRDRWPTQAELRDMLADEATEVINAHASEEERIFGPPPLVEEWDEWTDEQLREYAEDRGHHNV